MPTGPMLTCETHEKNDVARPKQFRPLLISSISAKFTLTITLPHNCTLDPC